MNITTVFRLLAVVALVFWVFYALRYVLGLPMFLTSEGEPSLLAKIGFIGYGYVTLLVGAFLGVVYKALREAKAEKKLIKIGNVIEGALQGADFWMALFASPVVYVVLLQAVDLENISLAGLMGLTLVGLQNGFVCNTIAESIVNRGDLTS
jgi:hypothetical protein